jgi:hypothetical protein
MPGKSKAPVVVVRPHARWRNGERRTVGEHIRGPSPKRGAGKSRLQLEFFDLWQQSAPKVREAAKTRAKRKQTKAQRKPIAAH